MLFFLGVAGIVGGVYLTVTERRFFDEFFISNWAIDQSLAGLMAFTLGSALLIIGTAL